MRVFWVTRTFDLGGAERALLELAPYLGAAGVQVRPLAVVSQGGLLMPLLRDAGMRPRVLGRGPFDPRWMWRLHRLVREERPDVVHVHDPLPGVGGRLACIGTGVRVVHTEHARWGSNRFVSRWANVLTFALNDAAVAVSREVRRSMAHGPLGRRAARSMRVIPNGLDLERVRGEAEVEPGVEIPEGTFGTVGHLTWVKGPDVLVRAAARIQRSRPDIACVLVGGGPLGAELASLAGDVGANVRFLGRRPDARAICARLGVYVQPSRSEGLPFAVLEAMALGRPIVATSVGGIPEVLTDEVDALLVPPDDPAALAAAIERTLGDRALAERLGHAAIARAEAFDARVTASALVAVYREVLDR